jgi:hypothetical protein
MIVMAVVRLPNSRRVLAYMHQYISMSKNLHIVIGFIKCGTSPKCLV